MILVQTPSGAHNRDFMNYSWTKLSYERFEKLSYERFEKLSANYLMKGLTKLWKLHINIMKLEGKSFLIHQIHQFFS